MLVGMRKWTRSCTAKPLPVKMAAWGWCRACHSAMHRSFFRISLPHVQPQLLLSPSLCYNTISSRSLCTAPAAAAVSATPAISTSRPPSTMPPVFTSAGVHCDCPYPSGTRSVRTCASSARRGGGGGHGGHGRNGGSSSTSSGGGGGPRAAYSGAGAPPRGDLQQQVSGKGGGRDSRKELRSKGFSPPHHRDAAPPPRQKTKESPSASTALGGGANPPTHSGPTAVPAPGASVPVRGTRGGVGAPPLLLALLRVVRPLEEAGFAYWAVGRTAAWLHGVTLPPPPPPSPQPSPPLPAQQQQQPALQSVPVSHPVVAQEPPQQQQQPPQPEFPAQQAANCSECDPRVGSLLSEEPLQHLQQRYPDLELEVQWDQMQTVHSLFSRPGSCWLPAPLRLLPGGRAAFTMTSAPPPPSPPPPSPPPGATAAAVAAVTTAGVTTRAGVAAGAARTEAAPLETHAAGSCGGGMAAASHPGPAAALPPVLVVSLACTYNTVLRANPERVLLTPHPPPPPPHTPPSPPVPSQHTTATAATAVTPSSPPHARQQQQQQPGGSRRNGAGSVGNCGSSSSSGRGSSSEGGGWSESPLAVLLDAAERGAAAAAGTLGGQQRQELPQVWCQSLAGVLRAAERGGDGALAGAVRRTLRDMQRALSAHNAAAWGRDSAFAAWVARFGPPPQAAERLLRDPGRSLGALLPYLTLPDSPPLHGLSCVNLCGSHGHKAVALAALGARVTVVDASPGNAAYAGQLAEAAGLAGAVSYVVADVAELGEALAAAAPLAAEVAAAGGGDGGSTSAAAAAACVASPPVAAGLRSAAVPVCPGQVPPGQVPPGQVPPGQVPPGQVPPGQADLVLMEMGVLHYFLDLGAIMRDVVVPLLRPGGRLLLRDFHPASTKMLASRGRKHKVTGDYFATQPLVAVDVAYSKYEEEAAACEPAGFAAAVGDGRSSDGGGSSSSGGGSGGSSRARALLRRWSLGEVVSAVAGCGGGRSGSSSSSDGSSSSGGGLRVLLLDEEAGARLDDAGFPKTFVLLAEKERQG